MQNCYRWSTGGGLWKNLVSTSMHCGNKAALTGSMFMHYMESDLPDIYHKPLLH